MALIFGLIGTLFHVVFYEPVYNILILLYHLVGNFALSIVLLAVLLAVLLRVCLVPFEHTYSQRQGYLPLLLQIPLLYALFFSFRTLISGKLQVINADIYPFLPKMTHFLPTQFLWTNLTHRDPTYILPLIAAALTFILLRMAMPVRPEPAPRQPLDTTQPASQFTQFMLYLLPLLTFLFGLSFPAGIALYWCVGTFFMAVLQYVLAGRSPKILA